MAEERTTLLVVEDDVDVADMLNAYFRVQGYEVFTVNWGKTPFGPAAPAGPIWSFSISACRISMATKWPAGCALIAVHPISPLSF